MPEWQPVDNDVPTAAEWITYVANQTVSQVTSGTRPAGTIGQMIHESNTGQYQAHTGAAYIPFGGTAGWTLWTPTLTQSSAITYTAVANQYQQVGNLVFGLAHLNVTSAGVANNAVTLTLPVTAIGANFGYGVGWVRDTSATSHASGILTLNTATTAQLRDATGASTAVLGVTGATFALALASGDAVSFGFVYHAA